MRFLICSTTPIETKTLIYYTDLYLAEACRHFFPLSKHYNLSAPLEIGRAYLKEMADAFQAPSPTMTFCTAHRAPLEKAPEPVEDIRLTYLSDIPSYYINYFATLPKGSIVTYSDHNYKLFYDDLGLDLSTYFLPHGGPNQISRGKPLKDRIFPITFIGRLTPPDPVGDFETMLEGSDPTLIAIARDASQRSYHNHVDIYASFKLSCAKYGFSCLDIMPLTRLSFLLSKISEWIEMHRRLELLRSLKHLPVHIFGDVEGEIEGITDGNNNFTFHPNTTAKQTLQTIQNTRILLNPVAVFPGGSHERIWFGMANGCAVYTDPSSFLLETLNDQEHIFYTNYSDLKSCTDRISYYLQNIVDNSLPVYEANHTWIKRLESLFKQMPQTRDLMPKTKKTLENA